MINPTSRLSVDTEFDKATLKIERAWFPLDQIATDIVIGKDMAKIEYVGMRYPYEFRGDWVTWKREGTEYDSEFKPYKGGFLCYLDEGNNSRDLTILRNSLGPKKVLVEVDIDKITAVGDVRNWYSFPFGDRLIHPVVIVRSILITKKQLTELGECYEKTVLDMFLKAAYLSGSCYRKILHRLSPEARFIWNVLILPLIDLEELDIECLSKGSFNLYVKNEILYESDLIKYIRKFLKSKGYDSKKAYPVLYELRGAFDHPFAVVG